MNKKIILIILVIAILVIYMHYMEVGIFFMIDDHGNREYLMFCQQNWTGFMCTNTESWFS